MNTAVKRRLFLSSLVLVMNTTAGYVADYREAGVTLLLWAGLGLLAFALGTLGVLRRRVRRSR